MQPLYCVESGTDVRQKSARSDHNSELLMSGFLLFDQPPSWQTPAMTNADSIRKLDVAKRQLIQAILLFLQGRDTVSVHTLAAAAHQTLSDIAIAKTQSSRIVHA